MTKWILIGLLALLPRAACAQDLIWQRDGKPLGKYAYAPGNESDRAASIREAFERIGKRLLATDTLLVKGAADFGPALPLTLPACQYVGDSTAVWHTGCQIDGTLVKPPSTPGFVLVGGGYKFTGMTFTGSSWNKQEDGGLIGWSGNEPGDVTFDHCTLDGRDTCAWVIYSWSTASPRGITLRDCVVHACRIGVAASGSGSGPQTVLVEDTKFFLDANGSYDYGETSNIDPVNGAVLTAVLNRKGDTIMRRCSVEAIGLDAQYDTRPVPKWGVSRIASLATNQYYTAPGPTTWRIEHCTSKITPGISTVVNDVDVRGAGSTVTVAVDADAVKAAQRAGVKSVADATAAVKVATEKAKTDTAAARGGSGPNGEMRLFVPPQ